jgi:RNA polymerase sigma-70 factor, ECF subfamily
MKEETESLPVEDQLFKTFCLTGDRAMFEKLYHMVQPWLKRMVYRVCADPDVTNDILQETWQKLLTVSDRYDPARGRINNLLFTIARNLALHHHRDSKRTSRLPENFEVEDKRPVQSVPVEVTEQSLILRQAIATLRENYQSVLLLHYYASLEVKEIADILQQPEGTVKTWLRRSRQELAKILPVSVRQ